MSNSVVFNVAVIEFPGSNCERETHMALKRCGMNPVAFKWNDDPAVIETCSGIVIVGGFSYEDRGRSGLIASKDPLMQIIKQHAEAGKPILGICNGAQVLVESGLVPGYKDYPLSMSLARNHRIKNGTVLGTGFYNDHCHLKHSKTNDTMHIPFAHAEGRFIVPDDVYQDLENSEAFFWQYCDKEGNLDLHFPTNPNGSDHNLAAVSNFTGTVLAIMPHPERNTSGDALFKWFLGKLDGSKNTSFLDCSSSGLTSALTADSPSARVRSPSCAKALEKSVFTTLFQYNLKTKLNIADNRCISIEKSLRQSGFDVSLRAFDVWSFDADTWSDQDQTKLEQSYELFNPSKATVSEPDQTRLRFLVFSKTNDIGEKKLSGLKALGFDQITDLKYGVLWEVETASDLKTIKQQLLDFNIFGNPISDDVVVLEPPIHQGKVRDIYELENDELLFVASNRVSAFDRSITEIEGRGEVLTQISKFWFEQTQDIISNHMIDCPAPNAMLVKKCTPIPIEVVVRGYMTGTTSTSVWTLYNQGERQFFETILPHGIKEFEAFDAPILTPSSKAEDHDEPLTTENIHDFVSREDWAIIREKAIAIFKRGQKICQDKGLILVDTKYEFGKDKDGNIVLIDEVHTPDSSRFWWASDFETRIAQGQAPRMLDKEILRRWYRENSNPYKDEILPEAPAELKEQFSKEYLTVKTLLTD